MNNAFVGFVAANFVILIIIKISFVMEVCNGYVL